MFSKLWWKFFLLNFVFQDWLLLTGLEIATNKITFATEFSPFATKVSGEVENLQLVNSPSLLQNKRISSCHFSATFANIKKEMTKLFYLSQWISCDVTRTTPFLHSFAIFSGFFTHKYCRLIFCFVKLLTPQCGTTILPLKFAKLQPNVRILSQNCDWIFLLISSPV